MNFKDLISKYKTKYPKNNIFNLRKGQRITELTRGNKFPPNEPGVYIIYGCKKRKKKVLYIGKAGTFYKDNKDGPFSKQKLQKRLIKGKRTLHQKRVGASEFYRKLLKGHDFLKFYWFVTYDIENKIETHSSFAEAELLQAYFKEKHDLPEYNREF